MILKAMSVSVLCPVRQAGATSSNRIMSCKEHILFFFKLNSIMNSENADRRHVQILPDTDRASWGFQ